MASSNDRQRQLARQKYERQQARRMAEARKKDRQRIIALVLIVSMVALVGGGLVLGAILT